MNLLIKNAKTIHNLKFDILVINGTIESINKNIEKEDIETIVLDDDTYISAGWIDDHVHCYSKMELYRGEPDKIGVMNGVTSIIDAGSTGARNIDHFYRLTRKSKTNVFALLNISNEGIIHQDELANLNKIQLLEVVKAYNKYPDFIIGIKARMSKSVIGDNGIVPLKMAKKIHSRLPNLPLMVHIGTLPPQLDEILNLMHKGDIVTHCFNGKNNSILDDNNEVKNFIWEARKKGILFDVGHGTASFNFNTCIKAKEQGFKCDTISSDIYERNRTNGPVYNLSTTMEKMLYCGYTLDEVLEMITEKPAQYFNLSTKGLIKEGYDADFTVFKILDKIKTLTDSDGNAVKFNKVIEPQLAIVGGFVYKVGETNEG